MQLDARLMAVAEFVEVGSSVADVGADHAYLAVALLDMGRALRVIATDKNEGPCEAAKRTLNLLSCRDKIEVRCGDGLSVIAPGEVDTICLAGMGGGLIREILAAHPAVVKAVKALILQPQNGSEELRHWLYLQDWHIADENLVIAEGRLYEIIKALPGKRPLPSTALLAIGPKIWEKKSPHLKEHIAALLFQARRAAAGMERSPRAASSLKFYRTQKRIRELEARLNW